jgi:hypothetical protein
VDDHFLPTSGPIGNVANWRRGFGGTPRKPAATHITMKLPRFTLRELFLLVVIAALGCGWWLKDRELRQWMDKYETSEAISSTTADVMTAIDDHWKKVVGRLDDDTRIRVLKKSDEIRLEAINRQ